MSGTASVSTQFAAATSATGAQLDGNFSTIVAYINDPTNRNNYAADTGGTNTVALTFSPPVVGGYTAGLEITFKAAFANSGAVVLNANGIGSANLFNQDGSALAPGQIQAGGVYKAIYNGTYFVMPSSFSAPATQAQMETATVSAAMVTPSNMKWHPGVAKAWTFVTQSAGNYTMQSAYNISGVSKGGTGTLTVSIATALSSTAYASIASVFGGVGFANPLAQGTSLVVISIRDSTGSAADAGFSLGIFGDLP